MDYLLAAGELYRLHLLRPVLVVAEVVLDGQRLQQLHRRLAANLTTTEVSQRGTEVDSSVKIGTTNKSTSKDGSSQ